MLELAGQVPGGPRASRLVEAAVKLGGWLLEHAPWLDSGWVPRRITLVGQPYPHTPTGGPDPIFDHSADGLFLLELYSALASRGLDEYREACLRLGDAFVQAGGWWGSLNHDTYDDHENVAYSVAYRVFARAADALARPGWKAFARQAALPGLSQFRMAEDRNGVATRGLLWMEKTWDTAYLWENAEAAQAFLESWSATGFEDHRQAGLDILRGIANHHHGPLGFLTEGVDWNNHVSSRHHVGEALYGDINYTEPLLNNLHLLGPTLFYFAQSGVLPPAGLDTAASLELVQFLSAESRPTG
jgi:hypothetical protein